MKLSSLEAIALALEGQEVRQLKLLQKEADDEL
jgi:hypothetical protein